MWVCSVDCICVYRAVVQWSGLGTLIMNCSCSGRRREEGRSGGEVHREAGATYGGRGYSMDPAGG